MSSLGDIFHAMPAATAIKAKHPDSEVHWVAREDMANLTMANPDITKTWVVKRSTGLSGLISLAKTLREQKFTHIYDAHNNLRSHLLCLMITAPWTRWFSSKFIRRSKSRLRRLLLFKLHINLLPQPYKSAMSFLQPLKPWGIPTATITRSSEMQFSKPQLPTSAELISKSILLAPSAAWPLKRWPVERWKQLIQLCPEHHFIIVGGPADDMCQKISQAAPERTTNLGGKLSWPETCWAIQNCQAIVSGDTGVMHVADFLNKPTLALIGPTAFGYPSNSNSITLEHPLPCRPCSKDGRGKCSQTEYIKCMKLISPAEVKSALKSSLGKAGENHAK